MVSNKKSFVAVLSLLVLIGCCVASFEFNIIELATSSTTNSPKLQPATNSSLLRIASKTQQKNDPISNTTTSQHYSAAAVLAPAAPVPAPVQQVYAYNQTSRSSSNSSTTRKSTIACTNDSSAACRCFRELGKNGTWVRDWDFARAYGQHPLPRNIPHGQFMQNILYSFVPTAGNPFPWETSWRWHDYNDIQQTTGDDGIIAAHRADHP